MSLDAHEVSTPTTARWPKPSRFPLDHYTPKGPPMDYDTGISRITHGSEGFEQTPIKPTDFYAHADGSRECRLVQADPELVDMARIEDTDAYKRLVVDMAVEQAGPDFDPFEVCECGLCDEPTNERPLSLPDDDAERLEYPMFDGLLAYFPNALAWVSRVSKIGNDQHNPGQPMHWAREKSTDHENKIMRHLVDVGLLDGRKVPHSVRLAWRALALAQQDLERLYGYPAPRAAR